MPVVHRIPALAAPALDWALFALERARSVALALALVVLLKAAWIMLASTLA